MFFQGFVFASNLYPPYFTIVFVLQGIILLLVSMSILFVFMVIYTENRSWKNISHISWINGLLIMTLSLFNLGIFTINIILFGDTCGVIYQAVTGQENLISNMIETKQHTFIEQCIFEDGDLASYLGISSQISEENSLQTASLSYETYSESLSDSVTVFTDYIALLQAYIDEPHTLEFADSDLIQPATMLSDINALSDTNKASSIDLVCMSAYDAIVDNLANCPTGAFQITSTSIGPTSNLGTSCCLVVLDLTTAWFQQRYTHNTQACTDLLADLSLYDNFARTLINSQ